MTSWHVLHVSLASLCAVLLIPTLWILAKTATIHVNCKCLLIVSTTTYFLLILDHQAIYISFLSGRTIDSDLMEDFENPWAYATAALVAFHTAIGFWIIVERFVAIRNAEKYAELRRPSFLLAFFCITTSVAFSYAWARLVSVEQKFILGAMIEGLLEMTITILSVISFLYARKSFVSSRWNTSLTRRHQLFQVLEFNKAVIPICITASIIKCFFMTLIPLWQFDFVSFSRVRDMFFLVQSPSCVILKWFLIREHRGLRRTFERFIIASSEERSSVAAGDLEVQKQTEAHFAILRSQWEEIQTAPASFSSRRMQHYVM